MEVAKEFLVERMFAPDRLGHDQALAVHLNDRREVGLSGPALQADHTLADMLVETGPFIATQSPISEGDRVLSAYPKNPITPAPGVAR